MERKGRITKLLVLLSFTLVGALLLMTLVPGGESKAKLSEISLVRPVFAQQATAFPADEAGISAYVNVGQSIDLSTAKSALRGIQAEGDNYVIGIMELSGLPEEEFPHMYISSEGWILAYYSKFAPTSRIFQWYGYEGGTITTTTLQDAISKICPTIGADFTQAKGNINYYHFKYSEATKMTVAVEWVGQEEVIDTFNFSIPYDVTLYEGSWSHSGDIANYCYLDVDSKRVSIFREHGVLLRCGNFEDQQVTPGKLHSVELIRSQWTGTHGSWAGVAAVFIYR